MFSNVVIRFADSLWQISLTACYTLSKTILKFVELRCVFFSSQYVFITEQSLDNKKTIHEQLSKYLMTTLKPGADPVVVNDLMKVLHCYETKLNRKGGGGRGGGECKRGEFGGGGFVGFFFLVLLCLPRIRGLIVLFAPVSPSLKINSLFFGGYCR